MKHDGAALSARLLHRRGSDMKPGLALTFILPVTASPRPGRGLHD